MTPLPHAQQPSTRHPGTAQPTARQQAPRSTQLSPLPGQQVHRDAARTRNGEGRRSWGQMDRPVRPAGLMRPDDRGGEKKQQERFVSFCAERAPPCPATAVSPRRVPDMFDVPTSLHSDSTDTLTLTQSDTPPPPTSRTTRGTTIPSYDSTTSIQHLHSMQDRVI